MKKVYVSLLFICLLSLSLVAAGTGWSIKDIFKSKESTVRVSSEASCVAVAQENQRLILLIMNYLGISTSEVETITGNAARTVVAKKVPSGTPRPVAASARLVGSQRRTGTFSADRVGSSGPSSAQIPEGVSVLSELVADCVNGQPPQIYIDNVLVPNTLENCWVWAQSQTFNSLDGCLGACGLGYEACTSTPAGQEISETGTTLCYDRQYACQLRCFSINWG